jgi:glycosyltransferase involved in cell wall biosynthesis/GT2 family glycosyltransferase
VLRRTLSALSRQRLGDVEIEVIVVDNGSTDGSREVLEAAELELPLRVLHEPVPGAGAARNAALLEARAELVLFLGDDSIPADPSFVAGHVAAHARDPDGWLGVVGHTEWDPEVGVTPLMEWLVESGKQFEFRRAAAGPVGPWLFYTNNLSLRRDRVLEAGGFDERFGAYGWEDHELGLRLAERGLRLVYAPALLVRHAHRYDLRASLRRMESIGRTAALLDRIRPGHAPRPEGVRGWCGRAAAPVLARAPVGERRLRAAHYAALARGYGSAPLRADAELAGRIERPPARGARPAVSVIVPCGDAAGVERAVAALGRLRLGPQDEAIVVDNSPAGTGPASGARDGSAPAPVRIVPAPDARSAYYARNVGAEAAANGWLLFLDDDCEPRPSILDEYFARPLADGCGAVAGTVVAAQAETRWQRYAASRGYLSQEAHGGHPFRPFGVTANLLVRRAAWDAVGGFAEGIRSGGDADLCWRLQEAGFSLERRDRAAVVHSHRRTARGLIRQALRYGAGHAWLERRHPGSSPRRTLVAPLARCVAAAAAWLATLRFERALFKLADAAVIAAEAAGRVLSNGGGRPPAPRPAGHDRLSVAMLVDRFPELSETFVTGEAQALRRAGHDVRVAAGARGVSPSPRAARGLPVSYIEDDGVARKARDLLWLVARHPLRAAYDMLARSRWRRQDEARTLRALAPAARRLHAARVQLLHVHFAGTAALDALRIGRLIGVPYSVTAHAWEIFRSPRNLREKLVRAAFAAGESEYATERLRAVAGAGHDERIHHLPAGVDSGRFARARPHPGGRAILALGRLVEKKGFAHLIRATALLARLGAAPDSVVIAGDGPLRDELEALADELGVAGIVQLPGALQHHEVAELMERADVFAMPSVVAANGDRDSMPNVVYEALAMELPVVASDMVGLSQVVRPGWGRLVAPGDHEALAAALAELLRLDPGERAAMGRAGREWVTGARSIEAVTEQLSGLMRAAAGARRGGRGRAPAADLSSRRAGRSGSAGTRSWGRTRA